MKKGSFVILAFISVLCCSLVGCAEKQQPEKVNQHVEKKNGIPSGPTGVSTDKGRSAPEAK